MSEVASKTLRKSPADSRFVARAILADVMDGRAPVQEALNTPALATLTERDRAFVRMLVMTTLRRRGWCDAMLAKLLLSPVSVTPPMVLHTLRLGLVQLFYMNVQPHAAVASSVNLSGPRHRTLVNAVLRRAQREEQTLRASVEQPERLLPQWLWKKLVTAYGSDTAVRIVHQQLETPPLDLLPLKPGEIPEGISLPNGTIRLFDAGAVEQLPGYASGTWQVQDAAASLPARLLGTDLRGKIIADLCAAPGGKTAQLAAAGAQVFAIDVAAARLERLQANLARLQLTATPVAADALHWTPPQPLDGVLLDAPCSATGTLRRHPDAAWSKTPADVKVLLRVQAQLLQHAAQILAPGGTLVYCVCSLLPEEGEEQVAAFLAANPSFVQVPVTAAEVPGLAACITAQGAVRTTPCDLETSGGIDGFYIVRLRKQLAQDGSPQAHPSWAVQGA